MMAAFHHTRNAARRTTISADVSKWRSPSVLIQLRRPPFIPEVIEDAADTHQDKSFDDSYDTSADKNPFRDLGSKVAFDDSTEAESDDSEYGCANYGSPNRKSFDNFFLFHISLGWLEFRCPYGDYDTSAP